MHGNIKQLSRMILIVAVTMAGCESAAYKQNIAQGDLAMKNQKYMEAIQFYTTALNEKPSDSSIIDKISNAKNENEQLERMKQQIQEAKDSKQNKTYSLALDKLKEFISLVPQGEADQKLIDEAKKLHQEINDTLHNEVVEMKSNIEKAKAAIEEKNYLEAINLMKTNVLKEKLSEEVSKLLTESATIIDEANLIVKKTLVGEWGKVPTIYEGYYNVKIQDSHEKMKIDITSTSNPPSSRVASISVQGIIIEGQLTFKYENDGWENKGTGTILLGQDNTILVSMKDTYKNPMANWSISGSDTALLKITETDKKIAATRDADARKREQELQYSMEKKRQQDIVERSKKGISLGMTKDEVLLSNWGKPDRTTSRTSTIGTTDIWTYEHHKLEASPQLGFFWKSASLSFFNGKLVAIDE